MNQVVSAVCGFLAMGASACGTSSTATAATPSPDPAGARASTASAWDAWTRLWNGQLDLADGLVTPDFVVHFAALDPNAPEVRGSVGLKKWIKSSCIDPFGEYKFTVEVGPIIENGHVAGRWIFDGKYRGGFPGVPPEAIGKKVHYAGHDVLRIEDGKIAEYWLTSDVLVMLQQLGALGR